MSLRCFCCCCRCRCKRNTTGAPLATLVCVPAARLRRLLLQTPLETIWRLAQVGVIDGAGEHRTISSGPLPAAVAASAAIPCIFSPVPIPGRHALLLAAASAFR